MYIDLNDEKSRPLTHQIKDGEGKSTGKQNIVNLTFHFYSKEIGDDNGNERVTTFAYKFRTSLNNADMFNNLL